MDKKIEETREFLQTIGMPKAQQADICCYVCGHVGWNVCRDTDLPDREI